MKYLYIFIFCFFGYQGFAQYCHCYENGVYRGYIPAPPCNANKCAANFGGNKSNYTANQTTTTPVKLTHFSAKVLERSTQLNWATESEVNNDGFLIERSNDGYRFVELDFVKGNGTTTEYNEYRFVDLSAPVGENYYRLKQIDENGSFEYSNVILVRATITGSSLTLAPNPIQVGGLLSLAIDSDTEQSLDIKISNITGQKVLVTRKSVSKGSQIFSIDTGDLGKGIYLVQSAFGVSKLVIQ